MNHQFKCWVMHSILNKLEICETFKNYMKVCFSICSNPAYDYIRSRHLSVGRNSKNQPSPWCWRSRRSEWSQLWCCSPVESIELSLIIKQHLLEGIPWSEFDVGACCQQRQLTQKKWQRRDFHLRNVLAFCTQSAVYCRHHSHAFCAPTQALAVNYREAGGRRGLGTFSYHAYVCANLHPCI